MRKENVNSLLNHAKTDLDKIESEYNNALKNKNIPDSLKIDIKNFLENLRSVLDYLAHDIYEQKVHPVRIANGDPPIQKIYFPYGKTSNNFNFRLGTCFPNLSNIDNDLFLLIEGIQPFKAGDSWLLDFCNVTNEKKHNSLTPQERSETQTMTASVGGTSVTMPINNPNFSIHQGSNCKVTLGGVPVRFTNQEIKPLGPGLQRTITTWVSFKFSNTNINVLPFLKKVYSSINSFSNQVYNYL